MWDSFLPVNKLSHLSMNVVQILANFKLFQSQFVFNGYLSWFIVYHIMKIEFLFTSYGWLYYSDLYLNGDRIRTSLSLLNNGTEWYEVAILDGYIPLFGAATILKHWHKSWFFP
jgi:hypothetical protein